MEKNQIMIDCYDRIYSEDGCFKERWDGKIATVYKVPKYMSLFDGLFRGKKKIDILELGAGNGEVSELIKKRYSRNINRYVTTEISSQGVKKLKQKGFEAYKIDGQDLSKFDDNSFNLVFCVDVLHHVSNPRLMAREMLRVTKNRCFMIEANGASALRRLHELLPGQRAAGEKSYAPWQYKSFFQGAARFSIRPFLLIIPFTPKKVMKQVIWFSETLEKIPILRWQCSGVEINVWKHGKNG